MVEYNIMIVGDGGVGKTAFAKRFNTGHFVRQYIATQGIDVIKSGLDSDKFNIIDTSGQEKFSDIPLNRLQIHGVIIMFDVTSKITYKNVPFWYEKVTNMFGSIPIVLCGNKVDSQYRKVKARMIDLHWKYGIKYYDVSAKSCYNYEKPFMTILDQLLFSRCRL